MAAGTGRRLCLLLLLPLLWLAGLAMAAEGELQPLPPRPLQPVTDLADALTPAEEDTLNQKLRAFAQERGSEIGILIVETTAPEDVFSYSFRVADSWKLGRKGIEDGLLIVLATKDRTNFLQVGYGLEGVVPDARSEQVRVDIMRPYLRRNDIAGALNAGTDTLMKLIAGENLPAPTPRQEFGGSRGGPGNAVFIALIAGIMASFFARAVLGRFLGGLAGGGVAFALALALGAAFGVAVFIAVFAMFFASGRGGGFIPGGFGRGGFGGGGGGGGFGSGGGGFGGGGSGGSW